MSKMKFEDRVVIVTGAAAGLGRAYAELLASLGAQLILNDVDDRIEKAAAEIAEKGGSVRAVAGSVADPVAAERIVQTALEAYGRIDGLINNAGIAINKPFMEISLDEHRQLLDVNLFGTINMTRAVWPIMQAAGYGRILNVTSTSLYGLEGFSGYAATKAAIFGLTRSLALEAYPLGINVNLIAPGAFTPMVLGTNIDPATEKHMKETMGPDKVAPIAAWLVHEQCTSVGKTYFAAGGQVALFEIGQTNGVSIGDDPDLSHTVQAMTENGMTENLQAEDSVHTSLKRRQNSKASPDN